MEFGGDGRADIGGANLSHVLYTRSTDTIVVDGNDMNGDGCSRHLLQNEMRTRVPSCGSIQYPSLP